MYSPIAIASNAARQPNNGEGEEGKFELIPSLDWLLGSAFNSPSKKFRVIGLKYDFEGDHCKNPLIHLL